MLRIEKNLVAGKLGAVEKWPSGRAGRCLSEYVGFSLGRLIWRLIMIYSKMMKNSVLSFGLILGSSFLASCGGSGSHKIVKDISIDISTDSEDLEVDVKSVLDLGNLTLPSLSLPVKSKSGVEVGDIALNGTLDGYNEISLAVNVSKVANIPGTVNNKLPNGKDIPIGGLDGAKVIQLDIAKSKAKAYMAFGDNIAMAGFAIPMKEFDSIGSSLGGINFFPRFKIGEVVGVAGIFTGIGVGQNGLALFLDLSSVVHGDDVAPSLAISSFSLAKSVSENGSIKSLEGRGSSLVFVDQVPDKSRKVRLEKMIYKLHKKRKSLKVH